MKVSNFLKSSYEKEIPQERFRNDIRNIRQICQILLISLNFRKNPNVFTGLYPRTIRYSMEVLKHTLILCTMHA